MSEHTQVLTEFCSITGADEGVAESFLAAHQYQLENALDTFFRDEPAPPLAAAPPRHNEAFQTHPTAAMGAAAAGQEDDYVEIVDDEDDAGGAGLAELARHRESALAAREQAEAAQDDEVAAAPAAGMSARASGWQQQQQGFAGPMDMGDDDLAAVAAAMAAAEGADMPTDVASYHRRQQEELLAMYRQQAAQQQQPAALYPAAGIGAADEAEPDGPGAVVGHGIAAAAAAGGGVDEPLDLPEGINIEEARMLEAAMLGVPYAGRIPDFAAGGGAPTPLSPTTLEQHAIRREQDQAYEESLALDRAREESMAAAAAAAEAAEREQQQAKEAAAAEAARAAEAMQQLLASKAARLPAEPDPSTAGVVQVVVRLPTGSRKARRFLPSDPLQAVFDFVDLACAAAAEGGGDNSCGIKPGAYRLVTQFPRKVLTESSGSLQDAGISTDTALFIEPL